jgi:hypothetical protein
LAVVLAGRLVALILQGAEAADFQERLQPERHGKTVPAGAPLVGRVDSGRHVRPQAIWR